MRLVNNELEFDKGEPAMRSCWKCNPAHKHLKNVDFLHWCFECGRYWIYGRFLDSFKTDKQVNNFIKKKNKDLLQNNDAHTAS